METKENLFCTKHVWAVFATLYITTISPNIDKAFAGTLTGKDIGILINSTVVAVLAGSLKGLDKNVYTPKGIIGRNKEDALPIVYVQPTVVEQITTTTETVAHISANPVTTVVGQITKNPVINQVASVIDTVSNPINVLGKSLGGSTHAQKTTPHDFGFGKNDTHLVMSDVVEEMSAFNYNGTKLWTIPALGKGVHGDDWRKTGADTPPGLYRLGTVYKDIETGNLDPSYGWYTFDMEDLENQETGTGRAGICLHGGGSGCPDPQAPYQELLCTLGCVRIHNQDLRDRVLPLYEQGTVYLTVRQ